MDSMCIIMQFPYSYKQVEVFWPATYVIMIMACISSIPLFILAVRKCNVESCSECIAQSDSICQTCFPDYELRDGRCRQIPPSTNVPSTDVPTVRSGGKDNEGGNGLSSDEIAGNLWPFANSLSTKTWYTLFCLIFTAIIAAAIILLLLLLTLLTAICVALIKKYIRKSSPQSAAP